MQPNNRELLHHNIHSLRITLKHKSNRGLDLDSPSLGLESGIAFERLCLPNPENQTRPAFEQLAAALVRFDEFGDWHWLLSSAGAGCGFVAVGQEVWEGFEIEGVEEWYEGSQEAEAGWSVGSDGFERAAVDVGFRYGYHVGWT